MTTGNETIDGTITRVNQWKSGKGHFVILDTTETEFVKFGGFIAQPGDLVRIEYKQAKGMYSDKLDIIRTEILTKGKQTDQKPKTLAEQHPQKPIADYSQKQGKTEGAIMRSVALKCASWIISGTIQAGSQQELQESIIATITMAKSFEPYLTGAK